MWVVSGRPVGAPLSVDGLIFLVERDICFAIDGKQP
jgi:hypothetical protein